jgi:peroxiredoxin Q/BCP
MNCEILGISFDTPADNKAFREKFEFPFKLLSDVDHKVGEAYGAAKGPDEQYPDFARRVSFLIDPEGRVAKSYLVSDIPAHPAEVLADIYELQQG